MDDALPTKTPSYLHPPIVFWRLALLMLATLGLYQLRWVYRSARELRATGRETTTPWLWIFAFTGPLVTAIALGRLGSMHQRWYSDVTDGVPGGSWITPVAVLVAILAQILIITAELMSPGTSLLAILAALLVLPTIYIGLLQSRVNAIKNALGDAGFHYENHHFTGKQWVTLGIGMPLALGMIAIWIWDYAQMGDVAGLTTGEYVTTDDGAFRVRIPERGWNRVAEGYLNEESDLSLITNDQTTWAVLYVQHNMNVASVMSNRAAAMLLDDTVDTCDSRLEMDDTLRAVGTILCTAAPELVPGKAHYAIRIVESGKHAAELIAYGEAGNSDFPRIRQRTIEVSEGLEVNDETD